MLNVHTLSLEKKTFEEISVIMSCIAFISLVFLIIVCTSFLMLMASVEIILFVIGFCPCGTIFSQKLTPTYSTSKFLHRNIIALTLTIPIQVIVWKSSCRPVLTKCFVVNFHRSYISERYAGGSFGGYGTISVNRIHPSLKGDIITDVHAECIWCVCVCVCLCVCMCVCATRFVYMCSEILVRINFKWLLLHRLANAIRELLSEFNDSHCTVILCDRL